MGNMATRTTIGVAFGHAGNGMVAKLGIIETAA